MKVLHMLQSDRFSGAENVVCQIISMCKGDKVSFAYSSQDGQIREALEERGIEFHPIKKMSVSEFRRVINEVNPDIIHAHDMGASFFASLACGKIPLISHIHNNAYNSRGISPKSILYYFAAEKAKHIFWVSKSSFEGYAFHKSFENKSTVLYNIIDVDALKEKMLLDKNKYNYDLVFLGRLTYPKNPQRLTEILELVVKKLPQVKMAIIGTGDLEEEIKSLAAEKGLSDNISFLGFQSNPLKILNDSKIMLMTSRWEGTPICALEAMALGVPIVSTPTDGLADLITDGNNGFLSDDNQALADRIIEILENEVLYNELSKNQSLFAIEYNNKEKYKNSVLNSYKQISE